MATPRDDAGRLAALWAPTMRIVRIGPQVARVVASLTQSSVAYVFSFDPGAAAIGGHHDTETVRKTERDAVLRAKREWEGRRRLLEGMFLLR